VITLESIIQNHPYLNTLPDKVKQTLLLLHATSCRFTNWFTNNQTKIISKLRGSRDPEDLFDVLTELRCAAFLLTFDEVLDLVYEPIHQIQKSPDFKAVFNNMGDIYFEVRRIRRTLAETKRDEFEQLFWEKVKLTIQRNFGLSLMISSIDSANVFQNLIVRLDEIVASIDTYLSTLPEDINESIEIVLDNFAEGLKISVSSIPPQRRVNNEIRNYGGMFSIPYSGNEYKKFGDIIFEKIHQLMHGERNIIFVYADNETHEEYDLIDSISSINDLIRNANKELIKDKGFESIDDFLNKAKRISGILLLTKSQERKLWINKGGEQQIADELQSIFEGNS